jgi:hypothetical protein
MHDNSTVRIMRESPYVRQLENAKRAAGGDKQLAAALSTSTRVLSKWLSGEAPPPMRTYMAALHLASRTRLRSRTA